ncbi:hypothetical protein SAMN04488589_1730 [Methanolobus vulcani]|uniref:RiboL-PSP-HEPN domain-containing protein n=1 Tax=Methanolobus vulcani TaxID=38026 RepID=A0A7Z7AX00_9EURY|nr:hypothetical protein [Methanolobus vulcani]SDF93397.1 hypothetical protein SAMN04488589_1730 [Methanolobus vulcani]
MENEDKIKKLNDSFHRNSGQILGMALHIETQLDHFIANYFSNPQNYRTLIFKDLIILDMSFGRKIRIFIEICKKEQINKKWLNEIKETIEFVQRIRNRVAHDQATFYQQEEKIVLQKKKSVTNKEDELEITDTLVDEVDKKRLFCLQEISKVAIKISELKKEDSDW